MAPATMPAQFTLFVLAITFLIIHASPALRGEDIVVPVQFSYTGADGPAKWGSLNPTFSACSNGKSQSPIDIAKGKIVLDTKLKALTRQYNSINATLINNGFNIGLRCGENSGVLVSDGKTYKFKQMHWHSPSEHRIDGVRSRAFFYFFFGFLTVPTKNLTNALEHHGYDAELHLVHIADDGSLAVVSILYHLGHPDPLITKIQNKLYQLAKEQFGVHAKGQIALGAFSMHQVKKNTRKYYRYFGSLTTPPCTEPVAWHILGKVRSISSEQLQALKAPLGWAYKNNSRPVQPLNGRQIELYEEVN
ncbi:hypothetical protein ACH5RR_005620 [Cinchona calisaya]|uniref:Alpha-carbonic anhydrase domain-containing protein n=1 Tax=Cinchona calisaya TaxID=153742 RepID=A0ABD3ALZ0_9GENT